MILPLYNSLAPLTINRLAVAAGPALDPDAQAYIDAVELEDGQALEDGVRTAINDFVVGCKDDGIWSSIKASCILAGARTLDGALTPLVGSAPTNNNFVSGDYDRETGLKGDGSTKYLDSNRADDADGQNNHHQSCSIDTINTITGTRFYIGADGSSGESTLIWNGGSHVVRSRTASFPIYAVPSTTTGLLGTSRSSSSNFDAVAGGSTTNISGSSSTPSTHNSFVFARSSKTGTLSLPVNARLSFYSIGESIDLADLDSRVERLMIEIKFAINTGLSATGYDIDTLRYVNRGYDAGGSLA